MSTPAPLLTDAFTLLGYDLYVHLSGADSLATQNAEWSADDMARARDLISDLVIVIRGLLVEHRRQVSGDCQVCASAWPCPVVITIHAFVKDPHRQFVALVFRARDEEG